MLGVIRTDPVEFVRKVPMVSSHVAPFTSVTLSPETCAPWMGCPPSESTVTNVPVPSAVIVHSMLVLVIVRVADVLLVCGTCWVCEPELVNFALEEEGLGGEEDDASAKVATTIAAMVAANTTVDRVAPCRAFMHLKPYEMSASANTFVRTELA